MTNEQLIQTVKEAMRNDTVLNKGMVELLCNALVAVTEQRDALVVENVALKKVISDVQGVYYKSDGVAGYHLNGQIATWDEVMPDLWEIETPATDAARAALRAEELQSYADSIALRLKDKELSMRQKERLNFSWAEVKAYMAELHNSQLRESKGAQS